MSRITHYSCEMDFTLPPFQVISDLCPKGALSNTRVYGIASHSQPILACMQKECRFQ